MAYIDYLHKRILIIDDLAEARSIVRSFMRDFGCQQIDVVGNSNDCMDLLQRHNYDLVLCDYNMGKGKDGQQILEEVRHANLLKHTAAFIMITSENTTEMVMGALEYSPDGYLTKPFT